MDMNLGDQRGAMGENVAGPYATNSNGGGRQYPQKFEDAMQLFLEAHCYAQDSRRDSWQFAIEIGDLKDVGLNNTDLRWLTVMKYVVSAKEVTGDHPGERNFEHFDSAILCDETCFIPTTEGINFAQTLLLSAGGSEMMKPVWEPGRRELCLMGKVVKQFNRPSCNQQRVIEAFQEDGWRFRIDDPLPPPDHGTCKVRLRQTIKALNRNQQTRLIRFSGDGTGEGVCWQVSDAR